MPENPEQPITPEDAASSVRDIIAELVAVWRERGVPLETLAEVLIDAGLEQIIIERGPAAAVLVLQELTRRTEGHIVRSKLKLVEAQIAALERQVND